MILAYLRWAISVVGYWIRPYDVGADGRRWKWRRRHRCEWQTFDNPHSGHMHVTYRR